MSADQEDTEKRMAAGLRNTPPHSGREIAARKQALGRELQARFYFYDERMFIVSAVSWIAEVGEPTVLPADVGDEALGRCICEHLALFETIPHQDASEAKLRDWGAFRVSGARSGRSFEERSYMFHTETRNSAVFVYAAPRLSLHQEISVSGAASAEHADLGAVVRRTLKAAIELRKAGII
jgi:hypothetical protein